MTLFTGCFRPSNKEIIDNFNDFITMFPTEDLTVLYDKEANRSSLPDGDLGTWVISSYLYTNDENNDKKIGIVLFFNRNTREVKGYFILRDVKSGTGLEKEYPIYYDSEGIHFVDENVNEYVKGELSNFNMMYNFISLDRDYLDSLEYMKVTFNGEVPLYGAKYKLASEDINLNKIKEIYPNLPVNENEVVLDLYGNGTLWRTASEVTLKIYLDEKHNNYFTSSMNLNKSDSLDN